MCALRAFPSLNPSAWVYNTCAECTAHTLLLIIENGEKLQKVSMDVDSFGSLQVGIFSIFKN